MSFKQVSGYGGEETQIQFVAELKHIKISKLKNTLKYFPRS